MKDLSVIIIHIGYKDYLESNLKITGKNNNIYLIGDQSIEHLNKLPNVNFFNIEKYLSDPLINYFKKHFINYSDLKSDFQWLCFLRIFIIKLFLIQENLDYIFHIDSDNILFYNINSYYFSKNVAYCINNDWHEFRMSCSVHSALINLEFCQIFEQLYVDIFVTKSKFYLIKDKINYHKNQPGGICDMTLYYLINKFKMVDVENLCQSKRVNNNYFVFMNSINSPEGPNIQNQYAFENHTIKINKIKKSNSYLIYDQYNDSYLQIFNIHFQGTSKYLIKNYI
jgi:hypothetical protein